MLATRMKSRQAAIAFIFVTVMLDLLALGLIAPVLPKLILDFLAGNMNFAAKWKGIFGTVFALMQFFFSPRRSDWRDRGSLDWSQEEPRKSGHSLVHRII